MLLSLTVKNFAIIDNIQVDFDKGMTVLTGETGAGKSLIIDAINLLFGCRASNDLVRYGENKALIEGVFSDYPEKVNTILNDNDIDIEENLIIRREIYQNGKSLAKINGLNCNLTLLEDLSLYLGDIHTQFDAIKLVNPKNYFDFIDNSDIDNLLIDYTINLKAYKKINHDYEEKKKNEKENLQKLEFLKYQSDELSKAKLSIDEELDLQNRLKILNNYEKLTSNYNEFFELFDNNNLLDNLYDSIAILKKNLSYDPSLQDKIKALEDAYYSTNDIVSELSSTFNKNDFDEEEFNNLNERLSLYSSLKRKYKMTTEELINYLDSLKKEVEQIENYDFYLEEIEKALQESYNKTYKIGQNIREIREKNAQELKENLIDVFNELQLKNTTFDIVFKDDNKFLNNGIDSIDFLISFNLGEPLKPLAKVASGGELSRFMLAIKSVSCNRNTHKIFIFDEIDSGVSGEIAFAIAKKIKDISNQNQVLCVTHLPQVASISDYQLDISKKIQEDGRTITNITKLDYDRRVESIALMISKGSLTEASIALAKELLNNSF